jgi:hypothetical protein
VSEEPVCDVLLTEEQLHYLGRYAQCEPSACSPFFGVTPPETLPQAALDDLTGRELLGPEGVEPSLLWTLELVKAAPACGGLSVRADAPQAELACYLSGEYSASLINTARGLRLVSPLPAGDLLMLLEDVLGTGSRREAAFSAELAASESRALAGALDLMRRDALRWTLDDRGEPLREDALAAWLSRGGWPAQWLTPHLGALLDRRGRGFDAANVAGAIAGLVDRSLFSRAAADLVPSAEVAALVRPLALLDRVIELRAVREQSGAPVAAAEVVLVRAHSPGLLLWELGPGGSVQWLTPTAAEAAELAARLLTNGDALGAPSDPGRP